MSLTGNIRTMSFPDILQWIAMGRKTGTLHLQRRAIRKRILFRDGTIYSSWSTDPRESLGQFLIRDRRITEEQLFKALLQQEQTGRLMGSILVSEGNLTESDLRATLKTKAEETVYSLFLWPEGQFEFKEGELPEEILIHVDMQVQEVVLEGARRVDEWERLRKVLPSMKATFELKDPPGAVEDPVERHVLELIAAGKTIEEISLELRRSEFEAAALVYDLYVRDFIVLQKPGEEARSPEAVAAIEHLLAVAYERLQEGNYEAARQAYKDVLALDRLNQHAKKGLVAVAETRNRDWAMKSVALNKIPVLTMDLASLTRQNFDSQEGFVLSRVNGQWDVKSILKLCPMGEDETLMIFARLLERKVIELR